MHNWCENIKWKILQLRGVRSVDFFARRNRVKAHSEASSEAMNGEYGGIRSLIIYGSEATTIQREYDVVDTRG